MSPFLTFAGASPDPPQELTPDSPEQKFSQALADHFASTGSDVSAADTEQLGPLSGQHASSGDINNGGGAATLTEGPPQPGRPPNGRPKPKRKRREPAQTSRAISRRAAAGPPKANSSKFRGVTRHRCACAALPLFQSSSLRYTPLEPPAH